MSTVTDAAPAYGDNRHVARRVSSPEFVGRAEELAALQAALERAARGEAAAVFVAGDSGVGKTRLLRELQRHAEAAGARVLRGDCVAFGAGELPYAPIAGALRSLMRELGTKGFDELVGPGRDAFARLLPELGGTEAFSGVAEAELKTATETVSRQTPLSSCSLPSRRTRRAVVADGTSAGSNDVAVDSFDYSRAICFAD